ncbi:ABC transporter substrate-binding protein [Desulfovibrio inopinatus]|uniref:ABC transporter substrate-binding protein n=1 Tax=Desulfovibrio inopinatus TaxID=102109 RepID=UPI00040907FA|nr:ABC transporter substrate-binding protein [Desulfovibrio inopinatus]
MKFMQWILLLCCIAMVATPSQLFAKTGEDTLTVVDATRRTVHVPAHAEKILITCYGGVTHQVVVLGAQDKIVGQPSMSRFAQLLKMKPELASIPDAGSFDNINIEEIITLNPDIVFAGIISKKGNAKIEDVGFPLVTMYIGKAHIDLMMDEFLRTGRVVGNEQRAQALVEYWKDKLDLVQDRVSTIPKEKRLRVYYMSTDILKTEGKAWWTQDLLDTCGAVNVAADIGPARETTIEKLLEWNPEVIVAQGVKGKDRVHDILNDPRLRDLQAVKTGRVYEFPIGAFWWNRPSPEAPLGFLWLTQTLYPEAMNDIDMKRETKDFFKTFFEYDLSDEEYASFLKAQM